MILLGGLGSRQPYKLTVCVLRFVKAYISTPHCKAQENQFVVMEIINTRLLHIDEDVSPKFISTASRNSTTLSAMSFIFIRISPVGFFSYKIANYHLTPITLPTVFLKLLSQLFKVWITLSTG